MPHHPGEWRFRAHLVVCLSLLAVCMLGACGPHAAVARFSREFRCPVDQVSIEDLGARSYRVTGCYRSATYVCLTNAYDSNDGICTLDGAPEMAASPSAGGEEEEDARRAAARQPAPQAIAGRVRFGGVEVPALRMSLSGMPLTFMVEPGTEPRSVLVTIGTAYAGQAERCSALEMSGGGARLSTPRHAGAEVRFRVPAEALQVLARGDSLRLAACQREMWLAETQRVALARFARAEAGSEAAPEGSTPAPASGDATPQVRAALDARRDVLLACAAADVLGVRARWDTTGAITVSLNGALAGSAEEACVRSQLEPLTIPSGAPAGEVVHVLTR